MCRCWLSCVWLLIALETPLQAAVAPAAALPLLTPGVVQQNYSEQISVAVSGAAPFTYLLGGDDKPEGLLLDPQSGLLHGSPTAAALGTHRLKVIVTDYNGKQTSKDFLLRVTQAASPTAATPAGAEGNKPVAVVHTTALSSGPPPAAPAPPAPPAVKPATAKLGTGKSAPAEAPTITSATADVKTLAIKAPDKFPTDTKSATYAAYHVDPGKPCTTDPGKQINTAAATSIVATAGMTTSLTLLESLKQESQVCAALTYVDKNGDTQTKESNVVTVTGLEANWGLIRAYFVGGILITNDSSSFSSAHQFYALNVDKTWKLPRCYLREPASGDRFTCKGSGAVSSVDLAGTTVTLQGPAQVEGAEITAKPATRLQNATITVTTRETVTLKNTQLVLHPGESFTVDEGTIAGGAVDDGSLAANATITIKSGSLVTWEPHENTTGVRKHFFKWLDTPGVSSYFETRLTSIPVVSNSSNTTMSTGTTPTTTSFLTSQQTANVGVGVYLPFLVTRWNYNNTPNALFIAPIGKVGFNTLTSATSQTVVLPSAAGTGTQSFEQIYNHYDYGFRIGHMALTRANNVAPEILSYLDIGFGRFSNLEDLICHRKDQGGVPVLMGSGCSVYPNRNYPDESRKRLYRMDIEGLLKIPYTVFYVGLNANIGQKQVMAEKLDPKFTAPDDLRFLFGTKFDIAQLFTKLGVKPQ